MEKSGIGLAGLSLHPFYDLPKKPKGPFPFQLGIASYTFRNYPLEKALEMTVRLNIKRMSLKSMHLPLESTKEQIQAIMQKVKNAGIEAYG